MSEEITRLHPANHKALDRVEVLAQRLGVPPLAKWETQDRLVVTTSTGKSYDVIDIFCAILDKVERV